MRKSHIHTVSTKVTRATRLTVALMGFVSLSGSSALAAQQKQLQLKWSELAQVITSQKVAMVLPSGTYIEGEVLAIEPDALGAGLLAGWFVALLICADEKPGYQDRAVPAWVGITGGLATAGHFAGREADRQITVITIVAESPPDPKKSRAFGAGAGGC